MRGRARARAEAERRLANGDPPPTRQGKMADATRGWMLAHQIAREMGVSPWDALLIAMRRAANWSAFYESKVAEVIDDRDLLPEGEAWPWLKALESATADMAKYAKMSMDAGVEERRLRFLEMEAQAIFTVLNDAIDGLPVEQRSLVRRRAMATISRMQIEGTPAVSAG